VPGLAVIFGRVVRLWLDDQLVELAGEEELSHEESPSSRLIGTETSREDLAAMPLPGFQELA
jgi:hypothetical protein